MANPNTVEEVLLAFENDSRKDSIGEEANEGYGFIDRDEALATIEQLVLERVIGEDEANIVEEYEPTLAQRNKNSLRSEQRQALTQILRGSKN